MKRVTLTELMAMRQKTLDGFFTENGGKVEVVIRPSEKVPAHIELRADRIVTTGGHVIKDRNGPASI